MTTLISVPSISDLFLQEILSEINRADCTILAYTPEINSILKGAGLPSQLISAPVNEGWEKRDKAFNDLAMPGVFGKKCFYKTNLPMHEVMSIDRLYFWYQGKPAEIIYNLINSLKWDKVIAAFDYNSIVTYQVLDVARKRKAKTVGVKTLSVRTREVIDYVLPFDEIIVSPEDASLFVKSKVITRGKERIARTQEYPSKGGLKEGLGVSGNLVGMLFDKRWEWNARRFLAEWQSQPSTLIAVPTDRRSSVLFPKVTRPLTIPLYGTDMLPACDEIVAFAWDDMLYDYHNVTIVDYFGKNLAKRLAPAGTRVIE